MPLQCFIQRDCKEDNVFMYFLSRTDSGMDGHFYNFLFSIYSNISAEF